MVFRPESWAAALVAAGVLVAGCAAPSRQHRSTAEAGANAEAAAATAAKAHAHYMAGVIHEMNDEPDLALEQFTRAALADPGNEELVLDVSRRQLQRKQPEKALELLTKATERPQASGALFARIGMVYSQLGKLDLAISASRTAIKKAPRSLAGYHNLVLNYLQTNQPNEALKVLEQAAKQPVADADFLIDLSGLYVHFARQFPTKKDSAHAAALAALQRAAKLNPANPNLRLKLADGFNVLGERETAAPIYLQLLKQYADLPVVRDNVRAKLTDIYLRGRDRERAVEQLEAIIKDDPTNAQAYYYLGSIAFEEKQFARAAEHFEKTLLLAPTFEQAYYDLASVQINLNRPLDALATLQKARTRFAGNFAMEYLTALAFNRQKNYDQAIKYFTTAEVIARAGEPQRLNEFFYFQLGAAHERKGDYEEAARHFEKSLELSPDFAEALNYLGYMWADRGDNLDRARELIEKAVKLDPKNAAYLDSLGWVLFKLNEPQRALEYLLKAIELAEEPDATLYDHLGDIYAALGEPDKAREAWRRSLGIEPNEQVAHKLEPASVK